MSDVEFWLKSSTPARSASSNPRSHIPYPPGIARLHVLGNDLINDPIFLGLFGDHDVIPLYVLLDPLERLARVTHQDVARDLAHAQDLARLDVDIGRLAG